MKSHKIYTIKKISKGLAPHCLFSQKATVGFTLIEILVVIAIGMVLASLGLFVSLDSFRSSSLQTERDVLVSVLEKARSESQSNIDEVPHGVEIESGQFVIFKGPTYISGDSHNQLIPRNSAFASSGISDVIFDQITGDVASGGTITLSDGGRNVSIIINNQGGINW